MRRLVILSTDVRLPELSVEPARDEQERQEMFLRESSHIMGAYGLASDYRDLSESGVHFDEWSDKPHRLLYDLLRVIDQYKLHIDELTKLLGDALEER